ncbi:MAG: radical SAM protein [Proteobacteria bacterium]|nr:radical SAM protein [Pseudomonadota bacterium]
MEQTLNHLDLYRLPWNFSDNGISWLEPTTKCNLRCQGCYRDLENPVHKSLEEMKAELEVFKRLRKSDCMSIAGGDPLLYPPIVELVKMIKEMGWKPIINTNGIALTETLLKDLKQAGAFGFTFHVDTSQNRPKAKRKSETELNEVRQHYAEMVAREGGLACSFNATVSEKTLSEIPNLVAWAQDNAEIVHTMVFILFRSPELSGDFESHPSGQNMDFAAIYKESEWSGSKSIYTDDAVRMIRKADPLYSPAAYLNGTINPDSLKWLLADRIVLNGETMGYLTPKFVEAAQNLNHFTKGTYLAYVGPKSTTRGKLLALLGAMFDKEMRGVFYRILRRTLTRPANLFRKAHMQSIMVIQPINIEADGRQDMCDGCPDMTVHEGKLVWSCRLEELNKFGTFVGTHGGQNVN